MQNIYDLSVITLTKNNHIELKRTLKSVFKQNTKVSIDLLLIDGSDNKIFLMNADYIKKQDNKNNIHIHHINSLKKKIKGIYKSMNLGIKESKGDYIIFMNSGDEFYDNESIDVLHKSISSLNTKNSFCFGQAKIITEIGLSWLVPGNKIKNIKSWLNFMRPNHQSMIVSKDIARKIFFKEDCYIVADDIWKREIILEADAWNYISKPVNKFYIGGLSSNKPTWKQVKIQFKNNYLSKFRKLIILTKFLIPKSIYKYFVFLQKFKLIIIEKLFLEINS